MFDLSYLVRTIARVSIYPRVFGHASRNRADLIRGLKGHPISFLRIIFDEGRMVLKNEIDLPLKALVHLRVALLVNSDYCLDVATAVVNYSGIDCRKIVNISDPFTGDVYTAKEELVIQFVDAVSVGSASDAARLREELQRSMTDSAFAELAATIAWDNHRGCLNRALGARSIGSADGMACTPAKSYVTMVGNGRLFPEQFIKLIDGRSVRKLGSRPRELLMVFAESVAHGSSTEIAGLRRELLELMTDRQLSHFSITLASERRTQCLSIAMGNSVKGPGR